jgi:purine-binding chemotaxis protein CheW
MSDVTALLLPVDGDVYALPLEWAHEVVAAPSLTHLVTAPPLVLGLFNLRGQIVPLLDTSALLGTGRLETLEYVVVVATARGLAGLAASGLPRRVVLDTPAGPSELPGTTGLFRVGRLVVSLLDPAQLLTAEEIRGRAG